MKILEEFWYGNIEPTEYDTTPGKEYKELLQLICRNEEKLQATFTDEQKDLFSRYVDCMREFQAMADCLMFPRQAKNRPLLRQEPIFAQRISPSTDCCRCFPRTLILAGPCSWLGQYLPVLRKPFHHRPLSLILACFSAISVAYSCAFSHMLTMCPVPSSCHRSRIFSRWPLPFNNAFACSSDRLLFSKVKSTSSIMAYL